MSRTNNFQHLLEYGAYPFLGVMLSYNPDDGRIYVEDPQEPGIGLKTFKGNEKGLSNARYWVKYLQKGDSMNKQNALILTEWYHMDDSPEEEIVLKLQVDNGDTTLGEVFEWTTTREMLRQIREYVKG